MKYKTVANKLCFVKVSFRDGKIQQNNVMPIRYFCDMSEAMNVDSVEILKQLKVLHILILFEKRVVYVCDIQNHNETMKFCGCNTTQVCI